MSLKPSTLLICCAALGLAACNSGTPAATADPTVRAAPAQASVTLLLSSPAFGEGERIPDEYTCAAAEQGKDHSPQLDWAHAPEGTQSFAMLMVDPDANGFVHWVIYNIPAQAAGLPQAVPNQAALKDGARQGPNSFGATRDPVGGGIGYSGPCPPRQHSYTFTLYALDAMLALKAEATHDEVVAAMEGHVLAKAQLRGYFP